MAQPCKVFSYTNVGTEKGVLANIASAAQAGGWTVDKNAVDADGELYLHSAGGGNRRLFFSLRLLQAHDNAERFLLAVHGNTGFDASAAWDAQPGRFTERLAHGYCSRTTGKPIWLRTPGKYSITSTGWWILPPVAEQIVLVCPTFVMTAMRVVYTFSDGANTPYSGWVPLMFGAADGFDAELGMPQGVAEPVFPVVEQACPQRSVGRDAEPVTGRAEMAGKRRDQAEAPGAGPVRA